MNEALSALLWGLSKKTIEKVKEYRTKGKLIQTRTLYAKVKVENFSYKKGSVSYQSSPQYIEREEWHWKDHADFIEKVIKKFPEYSKCTTEISKRCKSSMQQADFWLSRYIEILAKKAIERIDDAVLVDQITIFVSDLDKSPVDWEVEVWLDGIWLQDEQYKLPDAMILRRPRPSDLELETPFLNIFWPSRCPSAVLEFVFRARQPVEVQNEVELILDVLRLFKLGSISALETRMSPKSFLHSFSGRVSSNTRVAATYKYMFSSVEVSPFESLIKKIKPILPPPFDMATAAIDPIYVAFQRYKDALFQPVTIESRITSAMTCFEALYLKAEERMELSHRLSQRASILLRLLGFNPLEVYNKLSQAYEIRSTFIHGSQIEKERQQSAHKLCESILEYARVSLLTFLQLKDTVEKEKLISKLDNSLLDENALQKAKNLIGKISLLQNDVATYTK